MVRPDAQRTDSSQSSRNLLLTGKAHVDTKPQLEIFADDVKCAHGATVGQLDGEEVFYLKSRGLSDAAARNLLTYAFGAEIIDRIPVASLKHWLEQTVLRQTLRVSHDSNPDRAQSPCGGRLRRRAHPRRLPDPQAQSRRQAAGVSRQCGVEPDAAAGDRPPGALPDDAARQHQPRRALPVGDRDRGLRGSARAKCSVSSTRAKTAK